MSYDKNTWATGDTITAQKLNHMEDGIANAGGALLVNVSVDEHELVLDKTFKEIESTMKAGTPVIIKLWLSPPINTDFDNMYSNGVHSVGCAAYTNRDDSGSYYSVSDGTYSYSTSTENGYPSYNYYD